MQKRNSRILFLPLWVTKAPGRKRTVAGKGASCVKNAVVQKGEPLQVEVSKGHDDSFWQRV
jgi:hypothetical protein